MMVGPEHGGVGTATRAGQLVPLYNPFMPLDSRLFCNSHQLLYGVS